VNDVTLFTDVTLGEASGGKGVDITSAAQHPGAFYLPVDTAACIVTEADTSNMLDATGITGPLVQVGVVDMSAE
jgi:hypothetical protein